MDLRNSPKDRWTIKPRDIALIVIDMQRTFVDKGAPLECIGAREFVPRINKLAALCRKLKIPVIFVKANRRADLADTGLVSDFHANFVDPEMRPEQGKRGAEFCNGLDVLPADYIVPKVRFSAFIPGSSSLEPLLCGLKRNSFLICGVATDVCVGATTIDAMMLGYKVFFIGDLTATASRERQKVALEVYDANFAKVVTFDGVMKELARFRG